MILLALALAAQAPFDTKADYIQLARQHCTRAWPDDFQMQGYCLRGQAEGMLKFKQASEETGKPLEKALERCTEEWTSDRLPDWSMIGYCAEKQAQSYRALNPPSLP